jgi:hypothetical protein
MMAYRMRTFEYALAFCRSHEHADARSSCATRECAGSWRDEYVFHIFRCTTAGNRAEFEKQFGPRLWRVAPNLFDFLTKIEPTRRALDQVCTAHHINMVPYMHTHTHTIYIYMVPYIYIT